MALRDLRNLGPASEAMLREAGIETEGQLRELGAALAYHRVRESGIRVSLNLLYPIEGALRDVHWTRISHDLRSGLLIAVDALADRESR